MYNRDRRIPSILSTLDDLSDIDTRAADELRAVHHEHSITAFLEGRFPTNEDLHDCRSPLGLETDTEKRSAIRKAPSPASSQRQAVTQEALPPKAPVLSAPLPLHHVRRGTVGNGAALRRSGELDSPPPSPSSEALLSWRHSGCLGLFFDLTAIANRLLSSPGFLRQLT